jgi:hypothetical protein
LLSSTPAHGKPRTMPSLIVVMLCVTLGLLGFTVALLGAFQFGQVKEENRGRRYLDSLSHLYTPDKKDRLP